MRIDCHCDTVMKFDAYPSLEHIPDGHLDYRRLREYLDLSVFALYVDQEEYGSGAAARVQHLLDLLHRDVAAQTDLAFLLHREQLERGDRPLILIGLEGAEPLGENAAHLTEWYDRGLRLVGLTWNYPTRFAGSNLSGGGLTEQGRALVARCNELGVVLDAAHSSEETLDDLLACSTAPILDSHTVCQAVCDDYPRCISDRQLEALAEKGGVAAITFVPDFLGGDGGLDQLCRHIEHAVALVGPEHVGLGGDFDGADLKPELAGIQQLPRVYQRLRERGMSEEALRLVMGESVKNLLLRCLPGDKGSK